MINVLIVDDHQLFAESIAHRLREEENIHVFGLAKNESEAQETLTANPGNIDLVLLDIRMSAGETEGLDLAEYIRRYFPTVKVIMLSMHLHGAYIHRMFNAGIGGYLLKNTSLEVVLEAIHRVYQGKRYFPMEVRDAMDEFIMSGTEITPKNIQLTPTEAYILELIGEGMSSREISQKMGNKESTVEVHRRNILAKFGVKKVALLIREAIRLGFLSVDNS